MLLSLSPNYSMRGNVIHSTVLVAASFFFSTILAAQQSAETPAPAQSPSAESSSQHQSTPAKPNHSNDFLVRGTVFTQEGLALPGAELRIRRTSDKKFRWQTVSNSRGDFAVRVKMGDDYEVSARAKGYQEQSLQVDARTGGRFKDLVFRMQHQGGKKS